MANTVICETEADKVVHFINETKEGKYTKDKPDLTQYTYDRLDIQEADAVISEGSDVGEVILYGISCC
jgi:hypothetical protein